MINLINVIGIDKKPTKSFVPKKVFWELWKKHTLGKDRIYLIGKDNDKILFTVFNYFLKHPDFNKYNIILSEPSLDKGLLIYGDYGIGKSLLFEILHDIGKDLIQNYGVSQLWFNPISTGSFVDQYMKEVTKKEKNADSNFNLEDFYKGVLYIDDLGFEKKAFNKTELFGDILFERYRQNKKTLVTTNLTPSQIQKRYGERIGSRLPEMFNIIKWLGEDRRK